MRRRRTLTRQTEGSALVEFAIALPLLVVFLVGIYDFSGAFNQKQKIGHAAQEAAVIAGAQPMTDMDPAAPATANPYSLQPVLEVVFSSLSADNVLPQGTWASCAVSAVLSAQPRLWPNSWGRPSAARTLRAPFCSG